MWLTSFAIGLVLLGGPALAATGDALIVTGNGVNVRSGPSGDAGVMMRVYNNQQVIELQREGDWVRAEIAGTDGQEGWIHHSLLARPDGEPLRAPDDPAPAEEPTSTSDEATATSEEAAATSQEAAPEQVADAPGEPGAQGSLLVEPAAGPDAIGGELARFRETVDYLNGRATDLAGGDLFGEVEPGTGGVVQVRTTEAWSTMSPAGRQSFANTLLDRWAAAQAGEGPVAVQILDPNGEILMEKTEP